MKFSKIILLTMTITLIAAIQVHSTDHTGQQIQEIHEKPMVVQHNDNMFLEERLIDGYLVQFHVMEVSPDMEHKGSHNFMINIEHDGKVLDDVAINSKIIAPDGKSESKYLKKMGDWHMNGYNLADKGKYQLIILFKTADGKKHKGGVYYERS